MKFVTKRPLLHCVRTFSLVCIQLYRLVGGSISTQREEAVQMDFPFAQLLLLLVYLAEVNFQNSPLSPSAKCR